MTTWTRKVTVEVDEITITPEKLARLLDSAFLSGSNGTSQSEDYEAWWDRRRKCTDDVVQALVDE